MIHKIHTGMELTKDYNIGGTSFMEVTYPGDRRDCVRCHAAGTYTVPLPEGTTATDWPANYWTPVQPTSAACLGCHDSVEAAAHAYVNTAPFGRHARHVTHRMPSLGSTKSTPDRGKHETSARIEGADPLGCWRCV